MKSNDFVGFLVSIPAKCRRRRKKIMKELKFRALKANEISVRVGRVTQDKVELILYKNARVDQMLLDEAVGPFNWSRSHREVVDPVTSTLRLSCTVSLYDEEKKNWVSKEDFGASTFSYENEKASASDSFKRACTNWGIGRELYTAPEIMLNVNQTPAPCSVKLLPDGTPVCYDSFTVLQLRYDETESYITALAIKNMETGKIVFLWDTRTEDQKLNDKILDAQIKEELAQASMELFERAMNKGITVPDSSPAPASPEDNADAVCDVGGSNIRGKKLTDLSPNELLYCYRHTGRQENKKAALNLAHTNANVQEVFKAAGIAV
jgi:hypothetical protein